MLAVVQGFAGVGVDRARLMRHQAGKSGALQRMQQRVFAEDQEEEECFGDANVVISDLNWRVAKLKLEEENTKRFLKARPRFLNYEECRKWVQAWNRWNSEEDWRQWISMGEKKNPYIPVSNWAYSSPQMSSQILTRLLHLRRVVQTSTTENSGSRGTTFLEWNPRIMRGTRIVELKREVKHNSEFFCTKKKA
jgi:hypothetical protein